MKKLMAACCLTALMFVCTNTALATASTSNTYYYTISPSDLADGDAFANGSGGEMFGYDSDSDAPLACTDSGAPGYGDSCFLADVVESGEDGTQYTSIRISVADLFGVESITLADLASISYYTNLTSGLDWQIKIYTTTSEDQTSGWYGYRFNFEVPDDADGQWTQYSTDDDLAVEWVRSGDGTTSDWLSDTYLSDLYSSYGTEEIMFIDIIVGYQTDGLAGYSCLDGIEISLNNGDTAIVNLVPEPATLALMGLGGLLLRKRKK